MKWLSLERPQSFVNELPNFLSLTLKLKNASQKYILSNDTAT